MLKYAALTLLLAANLIAPALAQTPALRTVWLDELDLTAMHQGWGKPRPRLSVQKKNLKINGQTFERGVGSHADGALYVVLDGMTERFQTVVGIDDETDGRGSVTIKAIVDKKIVVQSELLKGGMPPARLDIDLKGARQLILVMGDGGDKNSFDHVDWADAQFLVSGDNPKIVTAPSEEKVILTPPPGKEPRINGARIVGNRPGSPFLYRIAATGERPMHFSAQGLPEGLTLDEASGIIAGRIADTAPKTYPVVLRAKNTSGQAEQELRISVGDTLALTPPMGWNHWYAHYDRVTDVMMREAADIMISSGMADVGYQYVNIDDCWMNSPNHPDPKRKGPLRDAQGELIPNAYFPDMKALADYIHGKGLKAGLYTSPGTLTCAGFAGAWEHERQDARTFAAWGFDFLKYDWCSYRKIARNDSLEELQKPYSLMGGFLKELDRDIVFNLCQYGMGDVWTWGEKVGGHCWRTSGDLGLELQRYHAVAQRNAEFHPYCRPGAWNDPDYLLLGYVGDASKMGTPTPCSLTPNEQYSYMSLWCLMAAPLFFSGDMSRLDPFTLNILCNPEVIDIDQDPLGKQGYPAIQRPEQDIEIWTKPLEDGSLAVGLFNRAEWEQSISLRWTDIDRPGPQQVRDLWRQTDLGILKDEFSAPVPRHGVVLLRIYSHP